MLGWECAIEGCGATFGDVEELLAHQVSDHATHDCAVCGTAVPEGFFAIKHVFEEHSRAEFVRAYDADSDAIRVRESIKRDVEDAADVDAVLRRVDADGADAVANAGN